MKHAYSTTRSIPLETFPGVEVVLRKMTEGRRLELRKLIGEPNRRIREILREQANIEKEPEETRDISAWLERQDEFDQIMIEKINVAWIQWGVKQISGLEVDGRALGVEDWADWPSSLFDEILTLVKSEAELNGSDQKNSESATTSGAQADSSQSPSTAPSAKSEDGGGIETVAFISKAG
jgi:hypothetical protein